MCVMFLYRVGFEADLFVVLCENMLTRSKVIAPCVAGVVRRSLYIVFSLVHKR